MLGIAKPYRSADERYMLASVDEAIHAIQSNPTYGSQVGCTLLGGNGHVISRAHNSCHRDVRMHAEEIVVTGIDGIDLSEATLYTTAEPCNGNPFHKRKHCCEQIVDAGVGRVVVGTLKKKYEGGVDYMKRHGVKIDVNENRDMARLCRLLLYSCVGGQVLSKRALESILSSREKIEADLLNKKLVFL